MTETATEEHPAREISTSTEDMAETTAENHMLPTPYESFLALFHLSFSRIKEFRHENPRGLTPWARLAVPFAD